MTGVFHKANGQQITPTEVVRDIIEFIKEDPSHHYKVIVGTDSLLFKDKQADFVTAIVVHRVGNGGRYFWRRFNPERCHTLRDRIIREVMLSLDVAKDILAGLRKTKDAMFDFEIHADIGENGETKVMIQEVIGMIRAYNFQAKVKPESYAASKVADRHI